VKGIKAEAVLRRDHAPGTTRAAVPFVVREHLGAQVGDRLIFEEGSTWTAEIAAQLGRYFVVRLEKADAPEGVQSAAEAFRAFGASERTAGKSLEEAVRRKQEEATG
jgi:hypothetical protein